MFYPDEVRTWRSIEPISQANPRELELAKRLIEAMVAPFEPGKFRDTYREQVQQMIAQKIEGKRVARAPEPARPAQVIDIMQALQESLKSAKKPAASAAGTKKARTKRAG